MKSNLQLASLWDRRPIDDIDSIAAGISFIAMADPRKGKAAEGIAHCLRAMTAGQEDLETGSSLALEYLGRHGLGRPVLRLMTLCLLAETIPPQTQRAYATGQRIAEILDDPAHVQVIKPRLRLESEGAFLCATGLDGSRSRRAIASALLSIVTDRNDKFAIPMRDKQGYLQFIRSAALAAGMGHIAARTQEVGKTLALRASIPRRQQTGSGVFYPL